MQKCSDIVKKENIIYPILSNIDSNDNLIFNKTNCKFCQSEHRAEAEFEFEKTGSMKAAFRILKEQYKEEITYPAVRNHIINHYLVIEKKIKIKEYGEQLKGWINSERSRRWAMLERVGMLEREMVNIASETNGKDLDEQRKSADSIKKICDAIMALEDKISEMDKTLEPVEIVVTRLSDIISNEIKTSNSNEVKKTLSDIMKKLSESVRDLYI